MATKIFSVDMAGKISYQSNIELFNESYLGYKLAICESFVKNLEALETLDKFCFLFEPLTLPRSSIRNAFYSLFGAWGVDAEQIFVHVYRAAMVQDFVDMINKAFPYEVLVVYQAVINKDADLIFHYATVKNESIIRRFNIDKAIFYSE